MRDREELVREVVRLQRRVNRILRQYSPLNWISLNLTIAQLKSLLFIANEGTTNLKSLASALGVTPANVTGIVDRLVEQGLVSREENPADRRMLLLRLTDKGENLLANLREIREDYMLRVLEQMNDEQLAALAQGLSAFLAAADNVARQEAAVR